MASFSLKLPRTQPDAVYTSVITKDGDLTLPEGCLTDKAEAGNTLNSVVVTNSYEDGILLLYTLDAFDEVRANLSKLNMMDQNVRSLKRRIIGEAVIVNVGESREIRIISEYLSRLGFDVNQDTVNDQSGFSVMLLKYSNRLEITTMNVYKTITEELQRQQPEE